MTPDEDLTRAEFLVGAIWLTTLLVGAAVLASPFILGAWINKHARRALRRRGRL